MTFNAQTLGEGPPLAMLHGLFVGSSATWYFTAAPRLAARYKVLVYDLRGHGAASRPADGYGLDSMATDLERLLEGFAPIDSRVTLVGHSYGALIALKFALRNPERVARLALVEAPMPPSRVEELGEFTKRTPEEMFASLPPLLANTVLRGGRAATRLLERLIFLTTKSTLLADLEKENCFDLDLPGSTLAADLSRMSIPTLCVYGDRSSCRPAGERLASAIPGARLRILPGGHFLPSESAQAVTETLMEFCHG